MIDFHTHILPEMDDGAKNVDMSLKMLKESMRQGVDTVCATSHYYAYDESPAAFLHRRSKAFKKLSKAMEESGEKLPKILLGAEILYFPGMSGAVELIDLKIEGTPCLLIEPPMAPWTSDMIDEIEQTGINTGYIPVIAHIDRYMRLLGDNTLIDRVTGRRMILQVNASFFTRKNTAELAIKLMKEGKIHLLGSDCHNLSDRAPNLQAAGAAAKELGRIKSFAEFSRKGYTLLGL